MPWYREQTVAERIFDNIRLLAEVFGGTHDREIPKVPVLELAKCFDLAHPRLRSVARRRHREWPHWK